MTTEATFVMSAKLFVPSANSVDNVGNQHYVFNIKGNNYRLVVVIKFTIHFVYVRFIGTHKEYDLIDCKNI